MLAIISSDRCYISNLLDKLDYSKKQSPNKSEIYECNYKEHKFIILVTGYGKVNIASNLRYLCDMYKIKAMIIIGTAGSIQDGNDIFSAIIPISTLQFDVDFMPIGYLAGQIPKIEKALYKTDDDLAECLKKSAMKTGVNYSLDVIASSASGIYQHSVDSWIVDDDRLLRTDRSKISIQFDSVVNAWIEKYDYDKYEEQRKMKL